MTTDDADRLRREAKAREIAAEIQHGRTPSKTTVATQVRILADQLADLKHIANLNGQNISGILRELIAEYILRMRENADVDRSLDLATALRQGMMEINAQTQGGNPQKRKAGKARPPGKRLAL